MEQLKRDLHEVEAQLEATLDRLNDAVHALEMERWWRRTLVVLVVLGMVSFGAWMSYDRQEACDRANASREAIREGAVGDWDTGWETLVTDTSPEAEATRAGLLEAISAQRLAKLPPRDCSWPV